MAKIEVNSAQFEVTTNDEQVYLDNKVVDYDIIQLPDGKYHLVMDNTSYTIEVNQKNADKGQLELTINGRTVETTLHNKLAELLKSMGMESGKKKLKELKAPMPGLVLDVLVKAGSSVAEGDDLLVLEAMKMENALKSPQEGVIESISIAKQDKVEKNQILITFE